jgi:hypothetical protein
MNTTVANDDDDYEIGYRKPPKHSQFKKGQSGNSKGRPKKRKSFQELIQEELDTEITVGGRTMTKAQAVAVSLVNESIKGKPSARQMLLPLIPTADDELEDFDPSWDDQVEWQKTLRRYEAQLKDQDTEEEP